MTTPNEKYFELEKSRIAAMQETARERQAERRRESFIVWIQVVITAALLSAAITLAFMSVLFVIYLVLVVGL